MPRLTRRSIASKSETTPEAEESSRSTSRGRRGAKKEEPAQEDVAIGEPQGTPPKRGGRQAAKAKAVESKDEAPKKGQKPAGGVRSASRGKRGKKQEESEEEEEEALQDDENEEEAEEEKPHRSGARSRGRGKTVVRGGRSLTKGGKRKSAEKDEDSEEDEQEEEKTETVKTPGSRNRGKAAPVTPSPKGGRKGRGKAEPESEETESEKKEDVPDAEIKDVADTASENDVDKETKGRQKRTPNKVTDAPSATPPSGGRRGRGQKAPVKAPSARSSRRGGASTSVTSEADDVEQEEKEEPMETSVVEEKKTEEEPAKKTEEEPTKKTEGEIAKPLTPSTNVPEESLSPSKKRKLEEEEERTVKRPKVTESKNSEGSNDELSDFVIINKEDVPPSDSKEVSEALPCVVPDEPEVELIKHDGLGIAPPGEANISFVVPLTEAELTKQYTKKQDVDETSSTYVEVGSEAASDITGLSSRGFDVSDALSMDSSASAEQPDQSMELSSACQQNADDISLNSSENASTTAQENTQNNATIDVSNDTQVAYQQAVEVSINMNNLNYERNENAKELSVKKSISRKSARVDPLEMNSPSSTGILNRKFTLNPKFPVEMMDPAFCFSVVSYNILADCHLRRGDYSYTKLQYLDQGYRSIILLKELDYLDGDILCLQEVNPLYFKDVLVPAMASRGYEGNFIKRTKDYWDEGEATFVRTSKFTVVSSEGFSLKDLAYKELESSQLNEEVSFAAKKYLDRADVMLLTQIKCKKTGKLVTICNIHVVYTNDAQDVQCIQVASAIKKLVATAGNDLNPHIICGDFNSIQGSPGQQLAKDGYLSDNDIKRLQAINALTLKDGTTCALINHMWGAFQHTSSNLKSAYEIALGREPTTTTYTSNTYGTLDYIFHSSFSLDTVGVLETIDECVLRSTGGLPTSSIPSDHLSLKAVFRLK